MFLAASQAPTITEIPVNFCMLGQEEETIAFEGETTITPFNMKDEMEEGHFDGDGFYHFKKDSEQIKDAWLDDIDWIKV